LLQCMARSFVAHVCTLFRSVFLFTRFFFNAPAPTEIYTLSLHDALPIFGLADGRAARVDGGDSVDPEVVPVRAGLERTERDLPQDRKSTRLNSSHDQISYAVFCLKKKKKKKKNHTHYKYI